MPFKRYFQKSPSLSFSLFSLILIFLNLGCAPSRPADFKSGEYRCEFCQMDIVDMRFKAEILSSKGKVHRFDSIECMAAWSQDHPEETSSRWVTSVFHPEKWLPMERAFFLKADRLSSPMGASLSAYETEEELRRALQEFGGRVLNGKDLEDFIRGPWRKGVFLGEKP